MRDEHCLDPFFNDLSANASADETHHDRCNESHVCNCNEQADAITCHSSDKTNPNQSAVIAAAAAVDMKHESLKVECSTADDEQIRSLAFSGSKIEPDSLGMSKGNITIPVIKKDADVKQRSSIGDSELDALPHQMSITPDNASGLILDNITELAEDDIDLSPKGAQSAEITENREQNADDPTEGQTTAVTILIPDVNDASKSVAGPSQPRTRRRKNVTFAENPNKSNKLPNGTQLDDRPFKCEICENRYRQKSGLSCHMKSHGNLFPFQCSKCRKGFEEDYDWLSHENRCKTKSYECYLCGHQFQQRKATFMVHMRRMHFGDDSNQFTCSRRCCSRLVHTHPKSANQSKQRHQKSRR